MTIGDVMAVVAGVAGFSVSIWTLLVGVALLCEEKAVRAQRYAGSHPKRAFGWGLLNAMTLGTLSLVLSQIPAPLIKLFGSVLGLWLFSVTAVGAAGIVRLVAGRIKQLEPRLSGFAALTSGAAFLVFPCLVPLLGWFAFTPLFFLVSLGAGMHSILYRERLIDAAPLQAGAI